MAKTTETVLRLRRDLAVPPALPQWPAGVCARALLPADAAGVHQLLQGAYQDGGEAADFTSWQALTDDVEFDPSLCFLAVDDSDQLLGVAQCWTRAFLKDLAVHPGARRRGIGESLLRHIFCTFHDRGAAYVDLKVDAGNAAARRLYERVGMRQVALSGETGSFNP